MIAPSDRRWGTGAVARPGLRTAGAVALAVVPLALLFGMALVGAVRQSLDPGFAAERATSAQAWRQLAADPTFWDALWFTTRIALLATALSAALALALAALLARRGGLARFLLALPLPVPHLIVAVGAVLWLGPGGLVERALGALPFALVSDPHGFGIVLVYVYKETPFLALLLLTVMGEQLRQRSEAAAVLGSSAWQRARWVLLPAVRRPLLLGSLIVAAFVFGSLEVPLAVGPNAPQTLAGFALQATQLDASGGQAVAAAGLLIAAAVSSVFAVVGVRLLGRVDG